ncbi:RNA polymerase sigma factor [Chitinophaga sp. Cy-1792]|uniref:RNA polymerase sigma factor n=1 Tax=Chitinophaga sp. Cy-1792 TaxID=2608339 RepID=UPI001424590B|nr:RNA polymerase sigma-70 factor [Chitinophaga sp. Cy-1792]
MGIDIGCLPDEKMLITQLKTGEEAAFREIYERYWEKQYDMAYYKLGTRSAAEEITQEVFVTLWLQRADLDPERPVAAWLYGVARNLILKTYRKQHIHQRYLQQTTFTDITNNTTEQLALNELNAMVNQQIGQLPDKCREVFTLSRVNGLNTQQIADTLNISPKTVNNHLVKAMKIMRGNLKDYIMIMVIISIRP